MEENITLYQDELEIDSHLAPSEKYITLLNLIKVV